MKKVKKVLLTGLIVFVHTGWIIPMYIGLEVMFTWFYGDVIPIVWGKRPEGTVFPLIFSEWSFRIALIWIIALVTFWSIKLSKYRFSKKSNNSEIN